MPTIKAEQSLDEGLCGWYSSTSLVLADANFGIKVGISGWDSCTALMYADAKTVIKVGNRNLHLGGPTRLFGVLGLLAGERELRPMIKVELSLDERPQRVELKQRSGTTQCKF